MEQANIFFIYKKIIVGQKIGAGESKEQQIHLLWRYERNT